MPETLNPAMTAEERDALLVECQQWARETFGPPPSLERIAGRAYEEHAELVRAWTSRDSRPEEDTRTMVMEEAADVWILVARWLDAAGRQDTSVARYAHAAGQDLFREIAYHVYTLIYSDRDASGEVVRLLGLLENVVRVRGSDMGDQVRRKLEINRARTWDVVDGDGHHVRDKEKP